MEDNFKQALKQIDPELLTFAGLGTLWANVGDLCNLHCRHCHVNAGPEGKKSMPLDVMDRIIAFLKENPGLTLDITGGAPELNPHFRYFVEAARPHVKTLMVRTNLCILMESECQWIPQWYADNDITLIGSLPSYTNGNVDAQRGKGVFEKNIAALRRLNELGYGNTHELNLGYNPVGAALPGDKVSLEEEFRCELKERFGIVFTSLFVITNMPIGRFAENLKAEEGFDAYMDLLKGALNPAVARDLMCRNLISVGHDGMLYNCDFNLAAGLLFRDGSGSSLTIDRIDEVTAGMAIASGDHCFGCTAGAGST